MCVGVSGNASSAAEFKLIFHEIIQKANLVDELIGIKTMGHLETGIQQFEWQ